jgi:murein peptide amidase A
MNFSFGPRGAEKLQTKINMETTIMRSIYVPEKNALALKPTWIDFGARHPSRRSISDFLAPLNARARNSDYLFYTPVGAFHHGRDDYRIPRYVFLGPEANDEPIRLGIFAAIHGDEPEGAHALVDFLLRLHDQPERARGYQLFVYPVCNPTGFEDGTRASRSGVDLNREFWRGSREPEVYYFERELWALRFHGVISLHSDDTTDGLYCFARGSTIADALARPMLDAAENFLPRAKADIIDNFAARDAVIRDCYKGVLGNPLELRPSPFELIFETPQRTHFELQVKAASAALDRLLAEYRPFLAQQQNI